MTRLLFLFFLWRTTKIGWTESMSMRFWVRLYNSDLVLTFQTCNKAPSSKKHKSFFLLSIHLLFTILIISTCVGFVVLRLHFICRFIAVRNGQRNTNQACLITHFILIYNPQFNYVRAWCGVRLLLRGWGRLSWEANPHISPWGRFRSNIGFSENRPSR